MKRKNHKLRAALCIGVSVLLLTTAVFANYDNANGYSSIKDGVKNVIYSDNYTMDITAKATAGGAEFSEFKANIMLDRGSDVPMSWSTARTGFNDGTNTKSQVVQDGNAYIDFGDDSYSLKHCYRVNNDSFSMRNPGEDEVNKKAINFFEAFGDIFVGDIKNNIVLSQTDGSSRTYTLNMTGEQLPKYMTAAVSYFCAVMREQQQDINSSYPISDIPEGYKVTLEMFMNENEPYVSAVNGTVTLDDHDRVTAFDGSIVFTGTKEDGSQADLRFDINLTIGEYGTTKIERINTDEYVNDAEYAIMDTEEAAEEESVLYKNEDGSLSVVYD